MAGQRKSARDVAEEQIEDAEPSDLVQDEPVSRSMSVGLGLLQGVFGEHARKIVRVGRGNDPLRSSQPLSMEEFREKEQEGQRRSDQIFERAEAERPGPFIAGGVAGIVTTPGPKGAGAAKAAGKVGSIVRNLLAKGTEKAVEKAAKPVASLPVRVMSSDGQRVMAVGSVEKIEDGFAKVFAMGKRIEVPVERLQRIVKGAAP